MGVTLAVAAKGYCQPKEFLEALGAQGMLDSPAVEVRIAHDEAWPLPQADLAKNLHLHACPRGTSILKLWGTAMAGGSQPFVAVLDIHCPPQAGWWERVRREIGHGTPIFFGPVNAGWDPRDARMIGYLAEYAQFHSPLEPQLNEVPGNNIVCRRSLLDDPGKLVAAGFFKTFMIWKLEREQNLAPRCFDDMVVRYRKPFAMWHYLGRRFVHGRCFAACRFDNPGQPPRFICLAFTPALPLLRCWRIYRAVVNNAELRRALLGHLPSVLLSEIAWSAGEFMGYAFGGRDYCDRLE